MQIVAITKLLLQQIFCLQREPKSLVYADVVGNSFWAMRRMRIMILVLFSGYLLGCKQEVEKVVESYPDGKPKIIFMYDDGKDTLNYQKKVLYNSGKMAYLGQITNGKKNGVWVWWYENGNKKDRCKYDGGRYIDTVYHWYEDGQLKQLEILPKENTSNFECDACNGTIIRYFENGKLKEKFTSKNGSLEGEYLTVEENGGWYKKTYKNDSLNGTTIEHNIDSVGNVIIVIGQYKDDKEVGYWQWYNRDSVLYQTVYYENGITSGLFRTYYPNGKVESEGVMKNGEYQGLVIYYDQKGKIVDKEIYKNGIPIK